MRIVLAGPLLVGAFEQGTESHRSKDDWKNMLTEMLENYDVSVYADKVHENYQTVQMRGEGNKRTPTTEYWCILHHNEC